MEIALEQYFQDWGHYPEHTSTRKVTWPRGEFQSPQNKVYLEHYQPYQNESSGFRDAWGNPFVYWCDGEHYRIASLGLDGTQKLKKFFSNQKISIRQRKKCSLLLSEDQIIWVAGYRIDNSVRLSPRTRRVLMAELLLA